MNYLHSSPARYSRILIPIFTLFITLSLPAGKGYASGINVEGLGVRAMSMGGAFVGLADDASAIFWNPAGLSQLRGSGMAMGVYTMTPDINDDDGVTNRRVGDPNDPYDPNKGDIFPAFYDSEPTSFDDTDELWLLAATMPSIVAYKNYGRFTVAGGFFGTGGAYSKYNDTIRDPVTDAKIDADVFALLALLTFNTSIGYQVTDKLSLGVGLDLLVNIWRGDADKEYLAPDSSLDYGYNLRLRKWGYGFQGNFGALYKFNDQWSIGAIYRTGSSFKLKGDTSVRLAGGSAIEPFKTKEKSDGHTDFKYGASWGIGLAYKPTEKLTLTFDFTENDWTDFNWPGSNSSYVDEGKFLQDSNGDPGWRRAHGYHVGMEFKKTDRVTLRAGYLNEASGVPSEFENTITTTIGDMQIVNIGMGVKYDKWTVDYMVGSMWGDNGLGVEHRCYDFAISFMRKL
jgi:long-chain fatty acid transport protein